MSKAEETKATVLARLEALTEGEPWMLADNLGRYESTVLVSPDGKRWTYISYDKRGGVSLQPTPPSYVRELDRDADWSVVKRERDILCYPPDLGMLNICRTEEGLAKLRDYAKRGGKADQYRKAQREKRAAEKQRGNDAFWNALTPQPHALVTGYTIDECRSGIQQSHPDKGGDPHLFELWKARLEHAKSQAASNQP